MRKFASPRDQRPMAPKPKSRDVHVDGREGLGPAGHGEQAAAEEQDVSDGARGHAESAQPAVPAAADGGLLTSERLD